MYILFYEIIKMMFLNRGSFIKKTRPSLYQDRKRRATKRNPFYEQKGISSLKHETKII